MARLQLPTGTVHAHSGGRRLFKYQYPLADHSGYLSTVNSDKYGQLRYVIVGSTAAVLTTTPGLSRHLPGWAVLSTHKELRWSFRANSAFEPYLSP